MKFADIIGRTIWYGILIAFVVLVFAVCRTECQIVEYRFENPALNGMVSNYDVGTLTETEALYLFNADVTSRKGRIRRRAGMQNYGVNTTLLYGAHGYYNSLTGDKLVIGVTDHATYELGQFVVSDTFGTEVGYDTLGGTIFPSADVNHDWTPYKDALIHADGKSIPCVFSTSQTFMYRTDARDTIGFEPHLVSMGMEAPGQLRVGVLDSVNTDYLTGDFDYTVAYNDSVPGIWSRIVRPKNQKVWITNFPRDSTVYLLRRSSSQTDIIYILDTLNVTTDDFVYIDSNIITSFNQRIVWWRNDSIFYDTVPSYDLNWYYTDGYGRECAISCNEPDEEIDSIGYRREIWNPYDYYCGFITYHSFQDASECMNFCCFFDSVHTDIDSFLVDSIGEVRFIPHYTGHAPGHFYSGLYLDTSDGDTGAFAWVPERATVIDTTKAAYDTTATHPDSLYYITYSYYDLITGIESPTGPLLACSLSLDSASGTDTLVYSRRFQFDEFDMNMNAPWVRVYQTVTKTTLPGASDSMVLYGILQVRAWDGAVILGNWIDDSVAVGLDPDHMNAVTYYDYQMLRENGVVKILPPYNYDCRIPFSDIEYIAGQFWGIGDPDNPNRVYYSSYYNPFSWYPLGFIDVNELGNDEFIKIERAEGFGDDALYLFAHNSIWLMNEAGDYQAISVRIGAASSETVVKHGEIIYFLSPDLRIYALSGTQAADISQSIENQVESVFVDWNEYGYQGFYAWGHTLGDYVRWFNDTTGTGLSFNTISGVWTLERYGSGAYVPRGSFSYDTLRSGGVSVAMTSDLELLYMDSAVELRKQSIQTAADAGDITNEKAIPFYYQTHYMGEGLHNWQVQEIDISIQPISFGGILRYAVHDEFGDSLCGDSIFYPYSNDVLHYRLHVPYNIGHRLSVMVFSNDTVMFGPPALTHSYEVVEMTVKLRDMGVGHVQ